MSTIGKLKNIFRPVALDADIDEELAYHLEQRTAGLIAAGVKPEDAARRARIGFGHSRQKSDRVGMFRVGVKLGGPGLFHDPAKIHHGHLI